MKNIINVPTLLWYRAGNINIMKGAIVMREIFRYKSKNILYSTGTYEEDEEDIEKRKAAEAEMQAASHSAPSHEPTPQEMMGELSPEQAAIVNASKSDNRISDSVASLVAQSL